jgi:succinate dehydrogenase/fumarate reductase flavoprotein subunit
MVARRLRALPANLEMQHGYVGLEVSRTATVTENFHECDVLVAGSGAAGLTAAVTARHHGLHAVVAEKEPVLGGTTARTAGSMWLPCNRIAAARGIEDSPDKVRTYLRLMAGERFDEPRIEAFIQNAPRVLDFFMDKTAVRVFCPVNGSDYHPELPGGLEVGRALYSEPFDGRLLGEYFDVLAPPLPELAFLGIVPQLGTDLLHFLRANRSLRSAWYVAGLVARRARDQLFHGRGTRLTNGTALAGRLVRSALDAGVTLWTGTGVSRLLIEEGRVTGAVVERSTGKATVRARRGVVLACGGFSHDESLRKMCFPPVLSAHAYWPATAPGAVGNGLRLGQSAGAAINNNLSDAAAWTPMSLVPRPGGDIGVLPILWGRAVPGLIAVTRDGRRFANEADSYHEFCQALIAATPNGSEASAFLVCDARALRRYGLGHVRPFPIPHGRHLRSGYLLRGRTLVELAKAAGIEAAALEATVEAFNRDARAGKDTAFGRGTTPYNRHMGDALHKPNPCLAPLDSPPFYAIKVVTGDIGTYAGLAADGKARVLDSSGQPIPGLYAAGNDVASLFGGSYPAGGTMLGPAVTFGFIAGRQLAGLD